MTNIAQINNTQVSIVNFKSIPVITTEMMADELKLNRLEELDFEIAKIIIFLEDIEKIEESYQK